MANGITVNFGFLYLACLGKSELLDRLLNKKDNQFLISVLLLLVVVAVVVVVVALVVLVLRFCGCGSSWRWCC